MDDPAPRQTTAPGEAASEGGAAAPNAGVDSEKSLLRFGPMGIGVSFSRPGLFTVTQQNCTEIVATDTRVCGVRRMPPFAFARGGKHAGELVFSVPWREVVEMQRADYLLNAALWIHYRRGDEVKELGLGAGLFWRRSIRTLEEIARRQIGQIADGGG